MTTLESTETQRVARHSRWPRALVAVVAVIVLAGVAVLGWMMTNDDPPVPADRARIEITFADDGTSFAGDHKIIEGTVTATLTNETDGTALLAVFGYETGSTALAEELKFLGEGDRGLPSGVLPAPGFFDVDFDLPGPLVPGIHTWTMDLPPGTYLFDVGPEDFMTTGLWRAAVIEVVAE